MKILSSASLAMGMLLAGMVSTSHAYLIEMDVYKVGSNVQGQAIDFDTKQPTHYDTENEGGVAYISWVFENVPVKGWATLTIIAEGIDLGEKDKVTFNGNEIGDLTEQVFNSSSFYLNPGPGVVVDNTGQQITALTTSVFTVWAKEGRNTVSIDVASGDWVNEIETSSLALAPVPEPTTMLLFATGLAGLAAFGRRKRS